MFSSSFARVEASPRHHGAYHGGVTVVNEKLI